MRKLHSAFCLAVLAIASTGAYAQANVTENQNTSLYVDASAGSDSNVGAQTAPFKTIQAAVNKAATYNQQGTGVKVIVNPGTYREAVSIGNYKATAATLTLEAAKQGTAVISALDVLTGWGGSASDSTHSWNYNFAPCAIPSGWPSDLPAIVARPEMLFVNGVRYNQVQTWSEMQPGTFYVNNAYSIVHVDPLPGVNMATALVEGSARTLTLSVVSRSNVVLRGLSFQGAASCFNNASATVYAASNVLVDSVTASDNNWAGLSVANSLNVTVQNSIANNNGGVGFTGFQNQQLLFQNNEADYNNWRGAQGAFYDWAMGGTKLFSTHGGTVINSRNYGNQAEGLWLDTDGRNITVQGAISAGNNQAALQVERNEGPITVQGSSFCSSELGATILTSQNVTLSGNTFYNNGSPLTDYAGQLFVSGTANGYVTNDWQTGQTYDLFTENLALNNNTFVNGSAGQLLFGNYLNANDWTTFATSVHSDGNTFFDATSTTRFHLFNGKTVDLSGWRGAVGDATSSWTQPVAAPSCAEPVPAQPDFQLQASVRSVTLANNQATAQVAVKTYGFGPVKFTVWGLPTGLSVGLSQWTSGDGVVTATITSKGAASGTYPVSLEASRGDHAHQVTLNVIVP